MARERSGAGATTGRALLRTADQLTVVVLIGGCFIMLLLHGCWQAAIRGERIEFDRAPPLQVEFQIDINQADWPEFTLLPRIGETLARRIVEYRRQHGSFRTLDELQKVRGIGPKTMRRIRPYLRGK
jgi:competence protein ComEA